MKINNRKIVRAVTASRSCGLYASMVPVLLSHGYEVVSVSSPGPGLDELGKFGVKVIPVPMERRVSVVRDLKALLRLIRVFHKERPNMVHSMTPKAGLLCMVAARICNVPLRVHTFTGLVWPTSTGFLRKVLMFTDWVTCACATHIIPEGKGVMDDLHTYITSKPMRVLGYGNIRGVDMTRFSRRQEVMDIAAGLRNDAFTFLFVGRVVRDKGVNELVEAFVRLNEKYVNTRLLLIGTPEESLDPLRPATQIAIDGNSAIKELGPRYGDELLGYYAASDCFVLPSYREGFPNTVLEAGAMGLPCIVTDINGSREIIENGKNGLIVPARDVDALYDAMLRIMKGDVDTEAMAKNARPMIESRFERGFVQRCTCEFYDELMKKT